MMAGANPAAVQRIMRHSDPRITTEVYGHLAPGYLQAEVDRLSFGPVEDEEPTLELMEVPQEAVTTIDSRPLVTSLLQDDVRRLPGPRRPEADSKRIRGLEWRARRDWNPRPTGSKPGALSS